MKTSFLFPYKYKLIGWLILVPFSIFGIFITITDFEFSFLNIKVFSLISEPLPFNSSNSHWINNNITNEITAIFFTIGALLAGFSKEKNEDEYIASLRLDALQWATYLNYGLLILSFLFLYEMSFLYVMVYNMFTVLIIFLFRFNFLLFRNNKLITNEE